MTPPATGLNETREIDLLEACPRCSYLLYGLPIQHRCPECGLELDRRWQIFGGRTVSRTLIWIGGGLGFMGVGVAAVLLFTVAATGAPWHAIGALGIVAVPCVYLSGKLLRSPICFIAVGPKGITVHRRRRAVHYAWSQLGTARMTGLGKHIVFGRGKSEVRLPVRMFFGAAGTVDAERCIEAINRHARADSP